MGFPQVVSSDPKAGSHPQSQDKGLGTPGCLYAARLAPELAGNLTSQIHTQQGTCTRDRSGGGKTAEN